MKETSNLKVVVPPPPRSPEREALAIAIADRQAAECELAAAKMAAEQASRRKYAAENKLTEFRTARDEEAPGSFAADLIESVKSGADLDVAAIGQRDTEAKAREEELQNAVHIWGKSYAACEASIPGRENDLTWCDRKVLEAARKVVAAHPDVAQLLAEAKKVHDDLDRRRNELLTVLHLASGTPQAEEINGYLARGLLIDERLFPICGEWNAAWQALLSDADTVLPERGL